MPRHYPRDILLWFQVFSYFYTWCLLNFYRSITLDKNGSPYSSINRKVLLQSIVWLKGNWWCAVTSDVANQGPNHIFQTTGVFRLSQSCNQPCCSCCVSLLQRVPRKMPHWFPLEQEEMFQMIKSLEIAEEGVWTENASIFCSYCTIIGEGGFWWYSKNFRKYRNVIIYFTCI